MKRNLPVFVLYSEGRQNIQEPHDPQRYTACVQLQHPIPITKDAGTDYMSDPEILSRGKLYLNCLVIATSDNAQLLIRMSKSNIIYTTDMGVYL